MKKVLSLILVVLVAFAISATKKTAKNAASKGNLWITGTASVQSFSGDLDYTSLSLAGSGVYFVINHLGVGGVLYYNSISDGVDSTDLGLSGKVIWAFDNFADKNFYPYAGACLGLGSISNGESESGLVLWIGGGMNYLLGKHIGILAELGYYSASLGDIDYGGFILQAGLIGVFKP